MQWRLSIWRRRRLALLQEFIHEQSDLKGFTGGNQLTLSPDETRLYTSPAPHPARWRVFAAMRQLAKLDYHATICQ